MARTPCFIAVGLALGACTTVTPVRGPDGTNRWYAVSCGGGKLSCYQAAAEQCPRGYIVADSSGGSVFTGQFAGYRGDMLIRCRVGGADGPAARPNEAPVAQPVPEKDDAQCDAVSDHLEDTLDLWAEWFHGTPADLPARQEFKKVCMGLDEPVQLCLAATYARSHRDACLAKIQALPRESRAELDALFTK